MVDQRIAMVRIPFRIPKVETVPLFESVPRAAPGNPHRLQNDNPPAAGSSSAMAARGREDREAELEKEEADLPVVLTVDEVATLLRVDRKTIYEMIRRGELPGVRRIRRAIRVSRMAVLEWLGNGQGRARARGGKRE
jgi:excisionase family DNA binding protein